MLSGSEICRSVSPAWPFCPPGFLLDFSRRLRTRAGLFSPSLDGGLPLFELFKPSRRSSSAILAFKAAFSATSAAICAACALTSAISSSREGSLGDGLVSSSPLHRAERVGEVGVRVSARRGSALR